MSYLPAPDESQRTSLRAAHPREELLLLTGDGQHHVVVRTPLGGTMPPKLHAHAELANFVCQHAVWPAKGVLRRAFRALPGLVESFGKALVDVLEEQTPPLPPKCPSCGDRMLLCPHDAPSKAERRRWMCRTVHLEAPYYYRRESSGRLTRTGRRDDL